MAWQGNGGWLNSIVGDLTHLRGWVAYSVITALVFGETAIFLGFVLPGDRWGAAFLHHDPRPALIRLASPGRSAWLKITGDEQG